MIDFDVPQDVYDKMGVRNCHPVMYYPATSLFELLGQHADIPSITSGAVVSIKQNINGQCK